MADETNYIGVAMGLDVSDLKAGLTAANNQIKEANKTFSSSTSGMRDWTKSAEGLQAKLDQLSSVLVMQNKKLAGLKAEYKKVAAEEGEASEKALLLQQQIKRQQTVVSATQREFNNYSDTLEGVRNGTIDLEKVTLKSGKAVKEAGKNVKKAGEEAEDSGKGFSVATGAVATFVGNGLLKLVGAATNAIKSIAGLADATREYRRTLATLDTAANDAGVNADKMRDKFTDLMGVFNDEASVTEGLNNLMAAGFDEKNIDAITAQLEGAALKFKDTLKFEGVSDGLQETLATGKAIGPFAELLERSGVNLETFDEGLGKATTSAEKQNYVLQELSKLGLADVSKNFREQNAEMVEAEKANVRYQNAVAGMGEKLEPVMTKVREGFALILEKILEMVEGVDLEAFAAKIEEAFGDFVDNTLPKIVDAIQWIIDNQDFLKALAIGIGVVSAALAVLNTVLAIQSAIMAANPVTWIVLAIVAAIAALIAIIVVCIKHWDKIKAAGKAAWDWIKNAWASASSWFKEKIIEPISNFFSGMWTKLKNGAKNAWEGIKSVFSSVGSWFKNIFTDAWTKVKNVFAAGGKIFDGIKDGIVTAFKKVVNAIIRGINKVVAVPFNGLNKVLDKISGAEIAGIKPFGSITWRATVPEIPELAQGGVLRKGQVGLLEGDGAEAVVPLERNLGWIKRLAGELSRTLGFDVGAVKSGLSVGIGSGANGGRGVGGNTVVNAGMTVNYNGKLSRKELKRIENDNYTAIRTRLKKEGAF